MKGIGDDHLATAELRADLISELVKEVLGPRNGSEEVFEGDPLDEYLTGVLSPISSKRESTRDPFADEVLNDSGDLSDGDIGTETGIEQGLVLTDETVLNPKQRPRSFGLSFQIEYDQRDPRIDICVTWARYHPAAEGETTVIRQPKAYTRRGIGILPAGEVRLPLDDERAEHQELHEIDIHVRTRRIAKGVVNVTVFVLNQLNLSPDIKYSDRYRFFLFQPQIRVVCQDCHLRPFADREPIDDDERKLDLLYRDQAMYARGHLCSAIWKEIDPARPFDGERAYEIPFSWPDGLFLKPELREHFALPDARTEFIPVFPVESPNYTWASTSATQPVLAARQLAELWKPDELFAALTPLVEGYSDWIESQLKTAPNETGPEQQDTLLDQCDRVRKSIRHGIDLLTDVSGKHDHIRLAFCFANMAMDLLARWRQRHLTDAEGLSWYPFQLAFFLMAIPSVASPEDPDREICDLLYVPTGAGKTEAYLAIIAFIIALRRLDAKEGRRSNSSGGGVAAIMRYTLRLLTIQQFRRAAGLITACEVLRVMPANDGLRGWRPIKSPLREPMLWGTTRFSIGLWVGGGVTPNALRVSSSYGTLPKGAIDIINDGRTDMDGEPAQLLQCPACGAWLSIPEITGLPAGEHRLHVIVEHGPPPDRQRRVEESMLRTLRSVKTCRVTSVRWTPWNESAGALSLTVTSTTGLDKQAIEQLFQQVQQALQRAVNNRLARFWNPAPLKPGYFISHGDLKGKGTGLSADPYAIEILCPNPDCPLNHSSIEWMEGVPPTQADGSLLASRSEDRARDGLTPCVLPELLRKESNPTVGRTVPISAYTVDAQIYHHPPSLLIATVDKFARLAFEPRAAAIFGNVDHYHRLVGYYREGASPKDPFSNGEEHPKGGAASRCTVKPFDPPDLIVQDELHLIEGPLGSMVGMYETVVDYLCSTQRPVKYIASTATAREAPSQARALFNRGLRQFPPYGVTNGDRFFLRSQPDSHPLRVRGPGRLYVGICTPASSMLTTIQHLWPRILQRVYDKAMQIQAVGEDPVTEIDRYWTLVAYFNTIRELAEAVAVYRQEIPERLKDVAGEHPRSLDQENRRELSSRRDSVELPGYLDELNMCFDGHLDHSVTPDVLFTTSMFGTGIDIARMGMMFMISQPKTTSAYIQSTGRIGRSKGGLVITLYRSARPRDMSHYETFSGFHARMDRFVEPVTVAPFAPGTRERCLGPVIVTLLRNARSCELAWHRNNAALDIADINDPLSHPDLSGLPELFRRRAASQPKERRSDPDTVADDVRGVITHWHETARYLKEKGESLEYNQYLIGFKDPKPVVLGSPEHRALDIPTVFPVAPQSLRDIEETAAFDIGKGTRGVK